MKWLWRLLGVQSPLYTWWLSFTSRKESVGKDVFGNEYFRSPAMKGYKRERRWVMYQGEPEASKVPPEWHGWLHHQTDDVPSEGESFRREWQKPHTENLTGTSVTYRPPGHVLSGGKRDKATGDYEAWKPSS